MSRLRLIIPVLVLVLSIVGVAAPSITSAAADAATVTIRDGGDAPTWGYTPTSTTVEVGQSVTWTNSGAFAHDAASTDGSWKTPLLNTGESATVTFATPGTFTYICTPHPWMQATIVVKPASVAPAPADPTPPAAVAPAPADPTPPPAAIAPAPADPGTPADQQTEDPADGG